MHMKFWSFSGCRLFRIGFWFDFFFRILELDWLCMIGFAVIFFRIWVVGLCVELLLWFVFFIFLIWLVGLCVEILDLHPCLVLLCSYSRICVCLNLNWRCFGYIEVIVNRMQCIDNCYISMCSYQCDGIVIV